MISSITSNFFAADAINATSAAQASLSSSITRLSSGSRFNNASYDIFGLALTTSLKTKAIILQATLKSVAQANSLLQVADSALQSINDILQRQKSLTLEASSGQLTDNTRSLLQFEFSSLSEEIDRQVANASFGGVLLLTGNALDLFSDSILFDIGVLTGTVSDARLTNINKFRLVLGDFSTQTLFSTAANIATATAAAESSAVIDNALTLALEARAIVGSTQKQLDSIANNLILSLAAVNASLGLLADTDIAAESTVYATTQVLYQAGIAVLAQANKLPSSLLKLIDPQLIN